MVGPPSVDKTGGGSFFGKGPSTRNGGLVKKLAIASIVLVGSLAAAAAAAAWVYLQVGQGSARVLSLAAGRVMPGVELTCERPSGSLLSGLNLRTATVRFPTGEVLVLSDVRLEPFDRWPPRVRFKAKRAEIASRWASACVVEGIEGDGGSVKAGRLSATTTVWNGAAAEVTAESLMLDLAGGGRARAVFESVGAVSEGLGSGRARSVSWDASGTVVLDDVELRGHPGIPGVRLEAQQAALSVRPDSTEIRGIQNGTLRAGLSEPVLFYGTADQGRLDFHVYAKYLDLRDLAPLLPRFAPAKLVSGSLQDVELGVRGTAAAPEVAGRFRSSDFSYRAFHLRDSAWSSDGIRVETERDGGVLLRGRLSISRGALSRGETTMSLGPGRFDFEGDPARPQMDLSGESSIGQTRIRLVLRGTPDKPDFRLTSDPPYSEEKLAVMLATGRSWEGSERALEQGELSLDATREFLDYFLLGGSLQRTASRLGIKALSLRADEESEAIRVKKEMSKNVDIGYGVEKRKSGEKEAPVVTQSVGVDYSVSKNTTLSVEGSVSGKEPSAESSPTEEEPSATDKSLLMKVSRRF